MPHHLQEKIEDLMGMYRESAVRNVLNRTEKHTHIHTHLYTVISSVQISVETFMMLQKHASSFLDVVNKIKGP